MTNVVSWSYKDPEVEFEPQAIPVDGLYHELDFGGGRIRVQMPAGRCLVLCWVSGDGPVDTVRPPLLAAMAAIPAVPATPTATDMTTGTGRTKWFNWATAMAKLVPWAKTADKAIRAMLVYNSPIWSCRVSRWLANGTEDFTERSPISMAPVADWAGLNIFELDIDPAVPISITVRNLSKGTITLEEMNVHFIHLPT